MKRLDETKKTTGSEVKERTNDAYIYIQSSRWFIHVYTWRLVESKDRLCYWSPSRASSRTGPSSQLCCCCCIPKLRCFSFCFCFSYYYCHDTMNRMKERKLSVQLVWVGGGGRRRDPLFFLFSFSSIWCHQFVMRWLWCVTFIINCWWDPQPTRCESLFKLLFITECPNYSRGRGHSIFFFFSCWRNDVVTRSVAHRVRAYIIQHYRSSETGATRFTWRTMSLKFRYNLKQFTNHFS